MSRGLFFRLDASARIGMGHLRRCLVLARYCRQMGAKAHFLIRSQGVDLIAHKFPDGSTVHEIPWEATPEEDARLTVEICRLNGLRTGVLDHFKLDIAVQKIHRSGGLQWMQFGNQLHTNPLLGALVHDASPSAHAGHYTHRVQQPTPRFLVGPRYALVGEAYAEQRARMKPPCTRGVESILLTFGAGDDRGTTLASLQWLEHADFHGRKVVLTTSLNPHLPRIKDKADQDPRIELHVGNWNPASIMAGCQLAICAGGTSMHEMACLGVPPLVVCIADNQWFPARAWQEAGMAGLLGNIEDLQNNLAPAIQIQNWLGSPQKLADMANRCWFAQDGRGAGRVAIALLELDSII
jgi:UDP-2,4-diacetamido-2,4,6-trideoxy-beta-L-altropyranose hydrolase